MNHEIKQKFNRNIEITSIWKEFESEITTTNHYLKSFWSEKFEKMEDEVRSRCVIFFCKKKVSVH